MQGLPDKTAVSALQTVQDRWPVGFSTPILLLAVGLSYRAGAPLFARETLAGKV